MKKVSALFLAMLMCMALAVPALAAPKAFTTGGGASSASGDSLISGGQAVPVKYEASLQDPEIKVVVPATNQALVLNPYEIKVKMGATAVSGGTLNYSDLLGSDGTSNSVLSSKLYLKNESTVALKMSLTATGSIGANSTASFATAEVPNTEKNKKVFLFVDVGQTVSEDDPEIGLCDATYTGAPNQGVIKNGDLKMTNVLDIPAPEDGANYATVQISGNCATTPTEAWKTTDTVTVSLAFTFQATSNSLVS